MMNNAAQIETPVTANQIPTASRINALPRHFGRHMMAVETVVFAYMRELVESYQGGYWEFHDLSNGGFYMAPTGNQELRVSVSGNYFDGDMSPDAAGIVACLFAYGYLANSTGAAALSRHFHWLRDYALDHPEAGKILAAID